MSYRRPYQKGVAAGFFTFAAAFVVFYFLTPGWLEPLPLPLLCLLCAAAAGLLTCLIAHISSLRERVTALEYQVEQLKKSR